mmetsp:Transcript_17177/g.56115  ORF Transcript_17177/g.56115 Transcript_17177/m.56115 type:complete len:274 (+) Transcript_17177:824-1645(+)
MIASKPFASAAAPPRGAAATPSRLMSLPSPIVGREAVKTASLPPTCCATAYAARRAGPRHVSVDWLEANMAGSLSSKETNASLRWHGCEELVRLGHDQHLGGGAVEVVEMERGVVGQQSDLGALAAREAIERVAERRGHATQHARRNRLVGHVDEKEEDGRLRRTDHVFLRRYKLHCPAVQLRPLHLVAARPRLVQLADVVGRTVVCQRADVTPPAPAVVDERHKGVDVRPAPPTAHHARRPKIHNGHGRLSAAGQRGDDCAERKRHFGLGGG